jgi:nucleoside-diphosphate-sugar epimerase
MMLHSFLRISLNIVIATLSLAPLNVAAQATPASQRAVLVTGASSGIGRNVTERLASEGWFVYAGARTPEDMASLNAMRNVQAVRLDVTVAADIAAAVETVRNGGRGLYGVVNNAGIAVLAPMVNVEEEEMQSIFDVNVFGPYRITKAFAPLLIESKGRVITRQLDLRHSVRSLLRTVQHDQARDGSVRRCARGRDGSFRGEVESDRTGQLQV